MGFQPGCIPFGGRQIEIKQKRKIKNEKVEKKSDSGLDASCVRGIDTHCKTKTEPENNHGRQKH
jgi:hypothetical protein